MVQYSTRKIHKTDCHPSTNQWPNWEGHTTNESIIYVWNVILDVWPFWTRLMYTHSHSTDKPSKAAQGADVCWWGGWWSLLCCVITAYINSNSGTSCPPEVGESPASKNPVSPEKSSSGQETGGKQGPGMTLDCFLPPGPQIIQPSFRSVPCGLMEYKETSSTHASCLKIISTFQSNEKENCVEFIFWF